MEFSIPPPANSILDRMAPLILQLCPGEKFVLGGGTALAARWQHRLSTDIDLFMDAGDFQELYGKLESLLNKTTDLLTWNDGNGWCSGSFAEGEFSIATTQPLINKNQCEIRDVVGKWGIRLEFPDEILAKKLRWRIYGNGEFVVRDCYDLVTAAEEYPDVLESALGILTERQRVEIAAELRSRKSVGMLGGRTLNSPHHPEWIKDLPLRTAEIVEHGPPSGPALENGSQSPPSFRM